MRLLNLAVWLVCCIGILTAVQINPPSIFPTASFHGYISVGSQASDIFYWGFASQSKPDTDPLIIWFNGGPGVSSILGLLEENGPFQIGPDGESLQSNPFSWNKNATIIYLDHPVGVGFSHSAQRDFPQTEPQNVPLMVEFFTELFQVRPELASLPLYLFGESYAGHFVPPIAQGLLQSTSPVFKLKGIGLGNTLMNVAEQYPEYSNFAAAPENINYTKICPEVFELTTAQFKVCRHALLRPMGMLRDAQLRDFCQSISQSIVEDADGNDKFDVFDIRNPAPDKSKGKKKLRGRLGDTQSFMNQPQALNELQADKAFQEETDGYFDVMTRRDWATDVSPYIGFLLDNNIKVLAYHGMFDYICNWMGGLAAIRNVSWSQQAQFKQAKPISYHGYGEIYQTAQLRFLKFKDAGHMVPQDQPQNSLDMVVRFTFDQE